jgi:hypothetical protein
MELDKPICSFLGDLSNAAILVEQLKQLLLCNAFRGKVPYKYTRPIGELIPSSLLYITILVFEEIIVCSLL